MERGGFGCRIIFVLFQLKGTGWSKFCFVSGLHPVVGEGAGRPPHVHSCCRSWRPPYRCQFIACQPYLSIHPFSNTHLFIHPPIHIHSTELLGVSLSLCLCCTLARFSNVHCNIRFFVLVYLYFCICICAVVSVYLYSSALAWFSNIHCTLRLFALTGPYTAPARCQSFNISKTKRRRKRLSF